jgi:hypothetical protein
MRKLMLIAAGLASLVAAGIAVADGIEQGAAGSVTGTFSATTVSSTSTKSCATSSGKTISSTKATYRGTAAGHADLAGPITVEARSVINTTDGLGIVEGKVRIDVAAGRDTTARFTAVYDHGKVAGLAVGKADEPAVALVGNLSATFSPTGGFTDGKIGGSAGGAAVELARAKCRKNDDDRRPERSEAQGKVSALSATSITVGGLTCAIPPALAAKAATLKVGDRAEIRCQLVNGQSTLVRITKKKR